MSSSGEVPPIRRGDFLNALQTYTIESGADASHLGLLLIDITNLARINHAHGYAVGDQILIAAGRELLAISKLQDTVFRIGSHCFAFILPQLGNPSLIALAINRVTTILQGAALAASNNVPVDVKVGISLNYAGARDVEEMLAIGESSLAHVKLGGHHRLEELLSDESDNKSDFQLEQYLASAIRDNDFVLHFQPKVNLKSGRVDAAEALLRWSTPDGEAVSPELVVGMAESMGRSFELTKWVAHQSMRQLKEWQTRFDLGIAFNVQAELVSSRDLRSLLGDARAIWGVDPGRVTLEITENAIIEDKEAGFSNLSQIRESGIKISIDDFGTGYSSLSYFKHIPAAELKIDKSFVRSLMEDTQNLELVKIMLQIARQFGMSVVAEGVEELTTLQLLQEMGCDLVQGYYIAPPMSASDFEVWLEQWPGLPLAER